MKLNEKLEYAKRAIASITQHDDESTDARGVIADAMRDYIDAEMRAADKRAQAKAKGEAAAGKKVAAAKKSAKEDVGAPAESRRAGRKDELRSPKRSAKH